MEPPLSASSAGGWHYLTRLESSGLALGPRADVSAEEGFIQVEPTLILDGGPELGLNLGAPVRLRLWGGGEGAGLVRREDWDSLSDWGQLVHGLKLGSDEAPVALWVGGLEDYSLLSAHLVRRYSNRANPDYHPAGAFLTATLGPLYTEAFASDVLGARLMGAEVALDVQHLLFGRPKERGRYTLALSAVHDWGRAGGRAPPVMLAHVDGTAVLVVRPGFEAHLLAGWGGRPGQGGAWGAVVGAGADAVTPTLDMMLRLALTLLSAGCASLPPGRGTSLHYTPHEATGPTWAEGPGEESPLALSSMLPSPPEPEAPERLHRRRGSREEMTGAGPGRVEGDARQRALAAHLALLGAVGDVSSSTRRFSSELARLKASDRGLARGNVFLSYADFGAAQLRWIEAELAATTELANAASEVEDPDMHLALLRVAGPRLEAAMLGSMLLAVWLDFLHLSDVVLSQRIYSAERLIRQLDGWRKMLEPSMAALSSLEPGQVEAAAEDVPALVGHLTGEFASTLEAARKGAKVLETALVLKESIEALATASSMKLMLPGLRPAAPAVLGASLMVGPGGVMMGTRIVVSAEWVEMMRRLVRAGVLSLPAVSAAVRIQAGQVMMAQGHDDLPQGVREALGDAPEVRAMRVTGKTGAGMAKPPRHHVMPKEFREWFEKRGFTGKMSIEWFCVALEQAHHEAIHGGGNWKLGREWEGEWNRMTMDALLKAESKAGRMLTRNTILEIVAKQMKRYRIPMNFIRCGGR